MEGESGDAGISVTGLAEATAAYVSGSVRVLCVLVDWMFALVRCWCPLTVAIEFGAYFVICLTVNSGHPVRRFFRVAFVQVATVGENIVAW